MSIDRTLSSQFDGMMGDRSSVLVVGAGKSYNLSEQELIGTLHSGESKVLQPQGRQASRALALCASPNSANEIYLDL